MRRSACSCGVPRFLDHDAQRYLVLRGDSPAVIVLRRNRSRLAAMRARCLDANLAPSRLDLVNLAMQFQPLDAVKPQSDRRGLRKDNLPDRVAAGGPADPPQGTRRRALLL